MLFNKPPILKMNIKQGWKCSLYNFSVFTDLDIYFLQVTIAAKIMTHIVTLDSVRNRFHHTSKVFHITAAGLERTS
jgi:hypothetical protein